jgi:hypothetical protein
MFEEVMPGLYRIIIPLPNSPLKDIDSTEQDIVTFSTH